MYSQTKPQPVFSEQLQARVGDLLERAVAAPGAERSRWLTWLLAGLAVLVLWRFGRGLKSLLWTLFGIGMAVWWSVIVPLLSR